MSINNIVALATTILWPVLPRQEFLTAGCDGDAMAMTGTLADTKSVSFGVHGERAVVLPRQSARQYGVAAPM